MRIFIYTGKGGVGKTSMAAAAACDLAAKGRRVLIMSTDQAHSLGDSFDTRLDDEPREVIENVEALEINTVKETRKNWGSFQGYLKEIIAKNSSAQEMEADEVLALPTFDELFSMLRILDACSEEIYDDIIVDCAPTGETLALLRFPERLGRLVKRLLPVVRAFNATAGFAVSRRTSVPRPHDNVLTDFGKLTDRLQKLQQILSDQDITSIRLVTTPERIVLSEARRNYTWMHMYGFNVDAVIINRIYPEEAMQGYFSSWLDIQEENIRLAEESFAGCHIFKMNLEDHEIRGIEALQDLAAKVYGDTDLEEVFVKEEIYRFDTEEGESVLIIHLPYAAESEIQVGQLGTDILLTLRNERRRFQLPDKIAGKKLDRYAFQDGVLKVYLK